MQRVDLNSSLQSSLAIPISNIYFNFTFRRLVHFTSSLHISNPQIKHSDCCLAITSRLLPDKTRTHQRARVFSLFLCVLIFLKTAKSSPPPPSPPPFLCLSFFFLSLHLILAFCSHQLTAGCDERRSRQSRNGDVRRGKAAQVHALSL